MIADRCAEKGTRWVAEICLSPKRLIYRHSNARLALESIAPQSIWVSQQALSSNQADGAPDLSLFHQINEHLINIAESTSYLFEPDGKHLTSLNRAWRNYKLLYYLLDLKADFKYLASHVKQVSFAKQIRKGFTNPKKIIKNSLISVFLMFCITSFLTTKVYDRLGKVEILEFVSYSFPVYLQIAGSFSIISLTLVLIGSFLVTITLFFANPFDARPLNYITDYVEKKYRYQQKWFIWLGLIAFTVTLFPSIAYVLFGIGLSSIKLAEITGLCFLD